MKKCDIFFSWASEYPNNRKFILEILDEVKQSLKEKDVDLEIQESTSDLPGFVDINNAIFQRIEKCDFFIADLSIVENVSNKKIPNPNVCFELGMMMGRHGESRIFGMYNDDYIDNPSIELPFDFSHNRAMRFKTNDTSKSKCVETIVQTILQFKENGDLNSRQPLKEHDTKLHNYIADNMEKYKDLINGFTENLEVYNGTDVTNNIDGDYDFLYDFIEYLKRFENRFADSSLESLREKLYISIVEFVNYQAYHTHEYFRDCGSFRKSTKLYLIENYPEKCIKYSLPVICDDTRKEEYKEQMEPFIKESEKYHNLAQKVLQCHKELEDRYIFLQQ